jgi:hypothetical protein
MAPRTFSDDPHFIKQLRKIKERMKREGPSATTPQAGKSKNTKPPNFQLMREAWGKQVRRDRKLPSSAKTVMWAISEYLNRESGQAFPSQRTLDEECGMSRSTVQLAIKRAQQHGHVQIEERTVKGGRKSHIYTPIIHVYEVPGAGLTIGPGGGPKIGLGWPENRARVDYTGRPEPSYLTPEVTLSPLRYPKRGDAIPIGGPLSPLASGEAEKKEGCPTNGAPLSIGESLTALASGDTASEENTSPGDASQRAAAVRKAGFLSSVAYGKRFFEGPAAKPKPFSMDELVEGVPGGRIALDYLRADGKGKPLEALVNYVAVRGGHLDVAAFVASGAVYQEKDGQLIFPIDCYKFNTPRGVL